MGKKTGQPKQGFWGKLSSGGRKKSSSNFSEMWSKEA